jgi:hypothetical protein
VVRIQKVVEVEVEVVHQVHPYSAWVAVAVAVEEEEHRP